jgi:hypothetical protein
MKYKYAVVVLVLGSLTVAGVVWSQSGTDTYSLRISPSGNTRCSALALLAPPFYKCSNMDVRTGSGKRIGTADWAYNNSILFLSLERDGDVTDYALPAVQELRSGSQAFPSCSAVWVIETTSSEGPQLTIRLGESTLVDSRWPSGCRPNWQGGTMTQ